MKKEKKLDNNSVKSDMFTNTSSITLTDSTFDFDKLNDAYKFPINNYNNNEENHGFLPSFPNINDKNGHTNRAEKIVNKKLLVANYNYPPTKGGNKNYLNSTVVSSKSGTCMALATSKTTRTTLSLSIYLITSLFLLQLALTTFGFYLQFSYLKNQNDAFEQKVSKFLSELVEELAITSSGSSRTLEPTQSVEEDAAEQVGKSTDYMILNLTHAVRLDSKTDLKSIRNFKLNIVDDSEVEQADLFNRILNENLNKRLRRRRNLLRPTFYHRVDYNNTNNFHNNIFLHHNDSETEYPDPGDHFLIKAYSKISARKIFCC